MEYIYYTNIQAWPDPCAQALEGSLSCCSYVRTTVLKGNILCIKTNTWWRTSGRCKKELKSSVFLFNAWLTFWATRLMLGGSLSFKHACSFQSHRFYSRQQSKPLGSSRRTFFAKKTNMCVSGSFKQVCTATVHIYLAMPVFSHTSHQIEGARISLSLGARVIFWGHFLYST